VEDAVFVSEAHVRDGTVFVLSRTTLYSYRSPEDSPLKNAEKMR
jgi:hypothetical protein